MSESEILRNRTIGGQKLASVLSCYKNQPDGLILALPRGGVPVAVEIATSLELPLDLCLVRKLGVPKRRELAFGAIALGGVRVLNQQIIDDLKISSETIERITEQETIELLRRNHLYRGNQPQPIIQDRTIILVDDGIATGASLRAAIGILGHGGGVPKSIIVAVPVASRTSYEALQLEVTQIFSLIVPENFYSLSLWYEDFTQVTDEEVSALFSKG